MDFRVFSADDELSAQVAAEVIDLLRIQPQSLLCIAAGHSSLGIIRSLVDSYEKGLVDVSQASFVAMDEWLGMSAATSGSCGDFLVSHFLQHVNFNDANIRLFDGTCADTDHECQGVKAFIKAHSRHNAIDYLILGAGMNGHLALNEPGCDFGQSAHVTALDPVTRHVGQKYFSDGALLTGGITLGIKDFQAARRCVLVVNGAHKADILSEIINTENTTNTIPATVLRTFSNASIYCDQTAAAKIS